MSTAHLYTQPTRTAATSTPGPLIHIHRWRFVWPRWWWSWHWIEFGAPLHCPSWGHSRSFSLSRWNTASLHLGILFDRSFSIISQWSAPTNPALWTSLSLWRIPQGVLMRMWSTFSITQYMYIISNKELSSLENLAALNYPPVSAYEDVVSVSSHQEQEYITLKTSTVLFNPRNKGISSRKLLQRSRQPLQLWMTSQRVLKRMWPVS